MQLFSRAAAVILVVALMATAAGATQSTQTQYFSGKPDFSRVLTFNQINLGPTCTLNWIKVTLSLNVNGGTYVLDNDAETEASGSFNFGGACAITGSSVTMLDSSFDPVVGAVQAGHSQTFSLGPNEDDGANDWSPLEPDGMMYVGSPASDDDSGNIASMFFGDYTGAGTFTVTIGATQWANYSGASGIETAINPVDADGFVEIVYDYTCVPEPGSILALVGGLGFLGLFRRRG